MNISVLGSRGVSSPRSLWHNRVTVRLFMSINSNRQAIAREAKAIVALAFRNGPIEDLHAGPPCPTCTGCDGYPGRSATAYVGSIGLRIVVRFLDCGGDSGQVLG